jgi:hypothetical protein
LQVWFELISFVVSSLGSGEMSRFQMIKDDDLIAPLTQKAHDRGADVPRSARNSDSGTDSTRGSVNGVVNSSLRFRIVRPVMAE